jgi:hypothetical protein
MGWTIMSFVDNATDHYGTSIHWHTQLDDPSTWQVHRPVGPFRRSNSPLLRAPRWYAVLSLTAAATNLHI